MSGARRVRVLLLAALAAALAAGEDDAPVPKAGRGQSMDYGPFLSYSLLHPAGGAEPVPKGLIVHLGGDLHACFDTDLLRWATVWTGPGLGLDLSKTNIGAYKGSTRGAAQVGSERIATVVAPGWSPDAAFADPRPNKGGPLPRAHGGWRGLFRHGDQVVLSYQVAGRAVLELPGRSGAGADAALTRTLRVDAGPATHVLIADLAGAKGEAADASATLATTKAAIVATGSGLPAGARLVANGTRLALALPALSAPAVFTLATWHGAPAAAAAARTRLAGLPAGSDPATLCAGGPSRWEQTLAGSIQRGDDSAAYAVDTVSLPEPNPWQSWLRPSCLDVLPDGRLAIGTLNGDVWIATLSASGTAVTWRRFAAGLFEPLGLVVVDGQILVTGRDQITRLRDLDRDGEADHYECFNNDRQLWPNYHTFAFDLLRDRAGNLYYAVGDNWAPPGTPGHNCLIRVSADGERSEVVATGFRAPNGLGIGPNDEITFGDNQGHWIPASKVTLVKPGGFHGAVTDPRQKPAVTNPPSDFVQPMCWVPYSLDTSCGGQAFVPAGDRWGPYGGGLLHLSYGTSALFAVLRQDVGGTVQAGIVRFPLQFASGVMRARFGPDGQLWLAGMKGWQTNGARDGALHRVRFTGKPVLLPVSFAASAKELRLGFAVPLDPASADAGNCSVQRWNYKWTAAYGSDEYSVASGAKGVRDKLTVSAARLDADGRTLIVAVDDLRPCMQQVLKVQIKAKDGAAIAVEVPHTIHTLP